MQLHVIDQNYLRKDDLTDMIRSSRSDEYFVITDAAFIEMTKSNWWEEISKKSLQVICKYPQKLLISESTPDIIRKELSTKKPIKLSDLFSSELTESVWDYLLEFQSQGQSGPQHSDMKKAIEKNKHILDKQQLNHSSNLKKLQNGCKGLRNLLNADVLKRMRNGTYTYDDLKESIAKPVLTLTASFLQGKGFCKEEIESFLMQDSFILRYQVAFTMLCLHWVSEGGVETLPAEKATNEFMDMDYVLIASYGGSILSKEGKVHRQLKDIKIICEILNS